MAFNRSKVLFFTLFTFIFIPFVLHSQEPGFLPSGKMISFNGKFVPKIPDGYRQISENGSFGTKYRIGNVGDEVREIFDFMLLKNGNIIYTMKELPGSDIMVSNAGHIAVFDTRKHFNQELRVLIYGQNGDLISVNEFRYASLFGFSPQGNYFLVGTGTGLYVIDTRTGADQILEHCSQFAFSADERILATAKVGKVNIYEDFELRGTFNTGFFYPRALAVSDDGELISVIDKNELITSSSAFPEILYRKRVNGGLSYRDLLYSGDNLLLGVHKREKGKSTGVMQVVEKTGELKSVIESQVRTFQHFEKATQPEEKSESYESIPWPFIPFDQMHTVWNYYEQHMGNGYDTWSYLHQGLDIITPINEPTYAVQAGYVKCILTLGGAAYWRVAISPEQTAGYSDGWLYAHLVEGSIQFDVGDYVEVHDYLGDIIYWSDDWGHIHFVEIRDQGLIWYYDDDEWGINFNPLLALTPNDDTIAPVIENFSPFSKFGFLEHGSSMNFLDANNLFGDIDIIAKIVDFHGNSPWELPAFETYYTIRNLLSNEIVVPRTLGRRLNHSYTFYSSAQYQPYAPLIYHKDDFHLPPSWMSQSRDYFHVLTRNNGDTLIDLSEINLSFPTAGFFDGNYMIYIEAWDECGNMAIDSMQVYFNNGNIASVNEMEEIGFQSYCFPNPANSKINIRYFIQNTVSPGFLRIIGTSSLIVKEKEIMPSEPGWNNIALDIKDLPPGVYYYSFTSGQTKPQKFIIAR